MNDESAAVRIARGWATPPSPEDAEAVRNLLQAYATFTDAGNVEALATLFTDNAEWDGTELNYGTARGPTDIAQRVAGHHRPDEPMAHFPGPPMLAAGDGVTIHALSWCMARRWSAGELRPVIYFSYEDELTKGDGGWRFQRRVLRAIFPG